nr:apolipoprotein A-I-like [Nerophis lumbriciformis]
MKFATLALTLLLAIGSQAASLQADAPMPLQHARAVVDLYVTQIKESAKRALNNLDGTEYEGYKLKIAEGIDELHTKLKAMQAQVSPLTDNVVQTIAEATQDFRNKVEADIAALQTQLEPMKANLNAVINKHIEEYSEVLSPVISEYQAKHTAEMEDLRVKLEPIMENLRTKIATNVEETKSALMPIIEAVRVKVGENTEALKQAVSPYVDEYKDQIMKAKGQIQSMNGDEFTALTEKISPMFGEIKEKFQAICAAIMESFSKN